MKLKLFQVDAFATRIFEGNPAAVCPLDAWLEDELLQKIAEENNLSETAFFVEAKTGFELRWFTPVGEVDLCGHATLAAAHVLFERLGFSQSEIVFHSHSGELRVKKTATGLSMDFPMVNSSKIKPPSLLLSGLNGVVPKQVLTGADYLVVLDSEKQVINLNPDFYQWLQLDLRGVIVTSIGTQADFVSRCFYPKLGVNEDPVTGSAHCQLTPYWSEELKRDQFRAQQVSRRGGTVNCQLKEHRVILSGHCVDYLVGEINI